MNRWSKLALCGVGAFLVLQLVRPGIPAAPATAEINAPAQVRQILQKDCYSCHSNERRLSWFDHIVPGYWLVRHDILEAREHLNFSTLGAKPEAAQKAALYESVNMIQLGAMPLPAFVKLHPEARVSEQDLAVLKAYLAPWPEPARAAVAGAETPAPGAPASAPQFAALNTVAVERNGLPFDTQYKSWKPISFTERGDNHTLRVILGNDVAYRAARTGQIHPWPDGARLAKIAWQEKAAPDGRIYAGAFAQIEFMVKDARQYQQSDGWGWGRWRGAALQPYGKDAGFVQECTGCHAPVKGADYVYTLPISAARESVAETINHAAAALPENLPYQPLGWTPITLFVDPAARTMSVLYGNEAAAASLPAPGAAGGGVNYRADSVLALVTWAQRDDPHWFGARIPDAPRAVEFVKIVSGGSEYRSFAGSAPAEITSPVQEVSARKNFLLALKAAPLP